MKKNNGYVNVDRDIRDSFVWKNEKEFSKLQALMDIIMEARFSNEPIELNIKGRKIICNNNECIRSINGWGKRWHWTDKRVRYFLNGLVDERRISITNEVVALRIKVLRNDTVCDVVLGKVLGEVKSSGLLNKDNVCDTVVDTVKGEVCGKASNGGVLGEVFDTVLGEVKSSELKEKDNSDDTVLGEVCGEVLGNIIIKNKEEGSIKNILCEVPDSSGGKSKVEKNEEKEKEMLVLIDLAKKFHEVQKRNFPNHMKHLSEKDHEIGAQELERLIRLDDWDLETQIKPALRFCLTDEFWKPNLKKLANVRKKSSSNGQTKFGNLFDAYERSRKFKDPLKKDEWQPVEKFYFMHDEDDPVYGSNIKKKVWTREEVAEMKRKIAEGIPLTCHD